MKKNCGNCKYFRPPGFVFTMKAGTWCSNSRSAASMTYVNESGSCKKFYRQGKKAPLWMRLLNKVMK